MKKNIYFKTFLILLITVFFNIATPFNVYSANLSDAFSSGENKALGAAAGSIGYDTKNSATPEGVVAIVLNIILGLLGVLFLLFVIYGGVLWMTAGGNEEQVKKATGIIQRSIIGLMITILAYAISVFVVSFFIKI